MSESKFRGLRTSSIVRELVDRIREQCLDESRTDLLQGLFLIEELALSADGGRAIRKRRQHLVDLLQSDDEIIEAGEGLLQIERDRRDAIIERLSVRVLQ